MSPAGEQESRTVIEYPHPSPDRLGVVIDRFRAWDPTNHTRQEVRQFLEDQWKQETNSSSQPYDSRHLWTQWCFEGLNTVYGEGHVSSSSPNETNVLAPLAALPIYLARGYSEEGDDHDRLVNYQLVTTKPPVTPRMIRNVTYQSRKILPKDYAQSELHSDKAVRMILEEGTWQEPIIRSLYMLSEFERRVPGSASLALGGVWWNSHYDANTSANAIGLLELLDNMDLFTDERFQPLAKALRYEAMVPQARYDLDTGKETFAGAYTRLSEQYHYSVMENAPFWLEGEQQEWKGDRTTVIVRSAGRSGKDGESITFRNTPSLADWDYQMQQRASTQHTIDETELYPTLGRYARRNVGVTKPNGDRQRAKDSARQELSLHREAIHQKRSGETKALATKLNQWRNTLEPLVAAEDAQANNDVFANGMRSMFGFFAADKTLGKKTRDYFARVALEGFDSPRLPQEYRVNLESYRNDPLFSWLAALGDPRKGMGVLAEARNYPDRFYFLFKLMAHTAARRTLGEQEQAFLFVPSHQFPKDRVDAVPEFIDRLRTLPTREEKEMEVSKMVQGVMGEVARVTRAGLPDIEDPQRIEQIQRKIVAKKDVLPHALRGRLSPMWEERVRQLIDHGLPYTDQTADYIKMAAVISGTVLIGGGAIWGVSEYQRMSFHSRASLPQLPGESGIGQSGILGQWEGTVSGFYSQRVPDRTTRDMVERLAPARLGTIIHAPESFRTDGTSVGYFPSSRFAHTGDNPLTPDTWASFSGFEVLANFPPTGDTLTYDQDYLVYILDSVSSRFVYPPEGFRFRTAIANRGTIPRVGPTGELFFDVQSAEQLPSQLLLVAEPVSVEQGRGFLEFSQMHTSPYEINLNSEVAQQVTEALAGDSALEELHRSFIQDLQAAVGTGRESEIIIQYIERYYAYTHEQRFYALGFQEQTSEVGPYNTLVNLAQQPDAGYYCSTASRAFEQFMRSAGVTIMEEPGVTARNYNSELWFDVGHVKNIVVLPSGQIVFVDMTPPVVEGKTPAEDIAALAPKDPMEAERRLAEMLRMAASIGLDAVAVVGVAKGMRKLHRNLHERAIEQRHESVMQAMGTDYGFSVIEQRFVGALVWAMGELPSNQLKVVHKQGGELMHMAKRLNLDRYGEFLSELLESTDFIDFMTGERTPEQYIALLDRLGETQLGQTAGLVEQWRRNARNGNVPGEFHELVDAAVLIQEAEFGALLQEVTRRLGKQAGYRKQPLGDRKAPTRALAERLNEERRKILERIAHATITSGPLPQRNSYYLASLLEVLHS